MGEFQLSWPQRASSPSLWGAEGAPQLRLDPDLQAALEAEDPPALLARPEEARRWLSPDWGLPNASALHQVPLRPLPGRNRCVVPRGAGPAQPRAGTPGDVLEAIHGIPCVKAAIDSVRQQAVETLEDAWNSSSTGQKAGVIASAVVLGGGALGMIYSDAELRESVLGRIQDTDLPVPGVEGLSLRLRPTGAAVTAPIFGVNALRGMRVRGSVNYDPTRRRTDWEVNVTFDLMKWLESR